MVSDIWLGWGWSYDRQLHPSSWPWPFPGLIYLIPTTWLCLTHFPMTLYSHCRPLGKQHLSRESSIFKPSCGALVCLREVYPAGQFGRSHGDGEPECQALALPSHPGEWPARSLQQPRRKHCQGRWVGGRTCRREFRFLFLFPVFTPCFIFIVIWLLTLFENLHSCITLLGNLLVSCC